MGLSWASPKNSKSRSTNSGGGGRGDQSYAKQKREAAARKATPKAKISYGNNNSNQRANLPSEVNRPAVRTTPLPSNNVQKVEARPSGSLKTGLTPKVAPKIKTTMGTVTNGYGVNTAIAGSDKGMDSRERAYETPAAINASNGSAEKKATQPSLLAINAPQESKSDVGFFEGIKNAATLLFDDPRTEESGRYNQKYWAERLAEGKAAGNANIQAELKAEQSKLGGSSKSYSQEKVPGYFEPLNHPSQKINAKLPVEQSSEQQITDIDNQIKAETNPAKLKALHQRRLSLLRMSRTNTKFAGLLGDADTKRTNLMSIS